MLPDDPRHGTNAGYIAHAFSDRNYCEPCRAAHVRKRKETSLKNLRGEYAKVPATGTVRRVQALLALGHTHPDIAAASGGTKNISKNAILDRYDYIHVDVARAIERAYRKLSMTVPTHWRNQECARRAQKLGYLPPLAWDDDRIDDPTYTPESVKTRTPSIRDEVDEIAVERFLTGDHGVRTTRAERVVIVAEWKRLGRPMADLERAGWKWERYVEREDGAA